MQTDIRTLTQEEQTAWRTLLRAQANVISALDKMLTDTHKLGLSDFEVLSYLADTPDRSLRMTELAHGVLLSPSGLTRRLDGLVRQGYVERKPSPSDGRGLLAVLTETGMSKVNEMAPTHDQGLRTRFIDCIEPNQLKELNEWFTPMANDESCAPAS